MPRYPIALLIALICITFTAHAQITLDGTLGQSGALAGPNYQIGADLGQQHGGNLFHSFRDFNLQSHESATFSGPTNVQNVISRVTGGNPSSIDGTIRSTVPNADMYFLNPYGVMFGPNTKLDVQGGFHVSTADYLRLQDGGRFEARVPGNSLLTVAPVAAFGFLTEGPVAIQVQNAGLSVPEGKTLSLVGGGLKLSGDLPTYGILGGPSIYGTALQAVSGRINLASVASPGEVIPTEFGLDFSESTQGGNLYSKNSLLSASQGGSIFIRGGRFELINSFIGSRTFAVKDGDTIDIQTSNLALQEGSIISTDSFFGTGKGGNIAVKATDKLTISGENKEGMISSISANTTIGKGGNINVQAGQVELAEGGQIKVSTELGTELGDGGTITIKTTGILSASGVSKAGEPSAVILKTQTNFGKSGNIQIEAGNVTIDKGAIYSTANSGASANITIKVADTLTVSGKKENLTLGIVSISEAGNGGNIEIEANKITLLNKAVVASSTIGTGKAGTITIKAKGNLTLSDALVNSASLSSEVNAGDAGNIEIKAGEIVLTAGSAIDSSTYGSGKSGKIELEAGHVTVEKLAKISSNTSGSGEAGTISIRVNGTLRLVDGDIYGQSKGEAVGAGKAGHIDIQANQIEITEGGGIRGNTYGPGEGGNIVLKAGALTISGKNLDGASSGILTSSNSNQPNGGKGGNIQIEAGNVTVEKLAKISSNTSGSGEAGTISIRVNGTLRLVDGDIYGQSKGEAVGAGKAGHIDIQANQIEITEGGGIRGNTSGPGEGGTIVIKAGTLTISGRNQNGDRSVISADSKSSQPNGGKGGQLEIEAGQLTLNDGAQITTDTEGGGEGGNIVIRATDSLTVAGEDKDGYTSGIYSRTSSKEANAGKAGNIEIEAHQVTLTGGGEVSNSTFGSGAGGNLVIRGVDTLTISGEGTKYASGVYSTTEHTGDNAGKAGNLEITAQKIVLEKGGRINSSSLGSGEAGTILIKATGELSIVGRCEGCKYSSGIFVESTSTEANAGKGGHIEIEAGKITLTEGGPISSGTFGPGEGGTIVLKVGTLTISGKDQKGESSGIFTGSNSSQPNGGKGGNIEIEAGNVTVENKAQISSGTFGSGDAGTISIKANGTLRLVDGNIYGESNAGAAGKAGRIDIQAGEVVLTAGGGINGRTFGSGEGGNIVLKAGTLTISGKNSDGASSGILTNSNSSEPNGGKAGTIEIEAGNVMVDKGALISSLTVGFGAGGKITIKVADTLTVSGDLMSFSSGQEVNAGNAGSIEIEADKITLHNAMILTVTEGTGKGGTINIKAKGNLTISDGYVSSASLSSEANAGDAESIKIEADKITLQNKAAIISATGGTGKGGTITIKAKDNLTISDGHVNSTSQSSEANAGDAGNIKIEANTVNLKNDGFISASANNAAGGGVTIITPNLLYLQNGFITTNVSGGSGSGGDIQIGTPVFLVLDEGIILAGADEGKGGNITITANHRISSKPESNNVIDATSKKNVSGKVVIKAQDEEVSGTLTILPATLQNYNIIKKHCTVEQLLDKEKRNSFVPTGRGGVSETPTDLRAGSVRDVMGEQLW